MADFLSGKFATLVFLQQTKISKTIQIIGDNMIITIIAYRTIRKRSSVNRYISKIVCSSYVIFYVKEMTNPKI